MLNVIGDLRERLELACGVPARVRVPKERPEELLTLTREGGMRLNALLDRAGIGIYCHAATEQRAWELATAVCDAMGKLPFSAGYAAVEQTAMYSDPDPDTRTPRWYLGYNVTNYEPAKEQ